MNKLKQQPGPKPKYAGGSVLWTVRIPKNKQEEAKKAIITALKQFAVAICLVALLSSCHTTRNTVGRCTYIHREKPAHKISFPF